MLKGPCASLARKKSLRKGLRAPCAPLAQKSRRLQNGLQVKIQNPPFPNLCRKPSSCFVYTLMIDILQFKIYHPCANLTLRKDPYARAAQGTLRIRNACARAFKNCFLPITRASTSTWTLQQTKKIVCSIFRLFD